jgi:hypothetical protein
MLFPRSIDAALLGMAVSMGIEDGRRGDIQITGY